MRWVLIDPVHRLKINKLAQEKLRLLPSVFGREILLEFEHHHYSEVKVARKRKTLSEGKKEQE